MANRGFCETLAVMAGSGTALTAAARASLTQGALGQTFRPTIPPNILKERDVITVWAHGIISSVVTTPGTARFDLSFGGTAILDSQAILLDTVAAHTNVGWVLRMTGTVRAVGTSANMMWAGEWVCEDILGVPATAPKGVLTAILPWNTTPALSVNFDSTVSNALDLQFTQTVTTGSLTMHQAKITLETSFG